MATMCGLCGSVYENYHNCFAARKKTDAAASAPSLEDRVADLERRMNAMAHNVEALRKTSFHAARVAKKAAR